MPKLSRMRLVSIGHPRARFDDLLLDFREPEGRATDSVLWLRNGGGKSSLLNLFYSVVRPNRTDFLGGKGGEEHRRLSDYVLRDDHAVVACEWELDGGSSLFGEEVARYLTIVFHEHRSASPTDGRNSTLRRLFLAAEVHPDVPELTIEGLPLTTASDDGRTMRRSLAGFRDAWRDLQAEHPQCGLFYTATQADWIGQLESRGIDMQLFRYQLDMNSREGGVTQLFTFSDAESFVDFLLETAFDSADAERVRKEVMKFRQQLERRQNVLQPDRELCQGLVERLAPFEQIAKDRRALCAELAEMDVSCRRIATSVERERAETESAGEQCRRTAEECQKAARQKQDLAQQLKRHAVRLRRHALNRRLEATREELERCQQELEEAGRQVHIWNAAVPLAEALEAERRAREYRRRLRERETEHAPLIEHLDQAANVFRAALSARINQVRARAENARGEADAKRSAARRQRKKAEASGREATVAGERAESCRTQQDQARKQWQQLLRDGVVTEEESLEACEEAVARIEQALSAVHEELETLDEERTAAGERRDELSRERNHCEINIRDMESRLSSAEGELDAQRTARETLASDETLRRLLGTETVDVDSVCREAAGRARREQRETLESILNLRVERADDEWATEYLRDNGRLPPRRDVLAVLEYLGARSIPAWSGWDYLKNNVAEDDRRRTIAHHPHLVNGVIVGNPDRLEELDPVPDDLPLSEPVAIAGGQQLLDRQGEPACVVWGPQGDGLFDSTAAGRAEAELSRRIEESCARQKEREEWRDALDRLQRSLEDYARRYPAGWPAEKEGQCAQLKQDLSQERARRAELDAAMQHLRQEQAARDERQNTLRARQVELVEARRRAADFQEQFGEHLATWKREEQEWIRKAEACEAQSAECSRRADELEGEARTCDAEGQKLATRVAMLRGERDDVTHGDPNVTVPAPASLDRVRTTYADLLTEYNRKVQASDLENMASLRDDDAARARRRFEEVRKDDVSEEDAQNAIESLDGALTPQRALKRATDREWRAKQAKGSTSRSLNSIEDKLNSLAPVPETDGSDGEPPIDHDLSAEDAEAEAGRVEQRAATAEQEAAEARERMHEAREQAAELQAVLERLKALACRTSDLRTTYADILEHAEAAADNAAAEGLESIEDCEQAGDELASHLAAARRSWNEMGSRAEQTVRIVREWCRNERFTALPEGIAGRFTQLGAADVEAKLNYYQQHLQTRLEQIDADLAEADEHRDIVVGAVLSAVDEALLLLDRIARLSRLPDTVPGGGRHFLTISTSAPEAPAERRALVGELVDEVIRSGSVDSGIQLVQRATRRVARPLTVRVLHPDLEGSRVRIHQMANFSGGERLTGAILLYCALAKLRSHQLGTTARPTSVLLLDNPIGTASRVRYLDLQREVARALGVQLIYATGVHDNDAVASLPNIIRLRNWRRDRRSGKRVVELEAAESSEAASSVDAIRVHMSADTRAAGRDETSPDEQRE